MHAMDSIDHDHTALHMYWQNHFAIIYIIHTKPLNKKIKNKKNTLNYIHLKTSCEHSSKDEVRCLQRDIQERIALPELN